MISSQKDRIRMVTKWAMSSSCTKCCDYILAIRSRHAVQKYVKVGCWSSWALISARVWTCGFRMVFGIVAHLGNSRAVNVSVGRAHDFPECLAWWFLSLMGWKAKWNNHALSLAILYVWVCWWIRSCLVGYVPLFLVPQIPAVFSRLRAPTEKRY